MQTLKIDNTYDGITYYINFDEISMISFFLGKSRNSDTDAPDTVYIHLRTRGAEKLIVIIKTYESQEAAEIALHELKKKYENICDDFNSHPNTTMHTITL